MIRIGWDGWSRFLSPSRIVSLSDSAEDWDSARRIFTGSHSIFGTWHGGDIDRIRRTGGLMGSWKKDLAGWRYWTPFVWLFVLIGFGLLVAGPWFTLPITVWILGLLAWLL